MVARPRLSVVAAALWAMLAAGPLVARQDALAHAKDLYASANYDEALKALEAIPRDGASSTVTGDIDEYRFSACWRSAGRRTPKRSSGRSCAPIRRTVCPDTTASPRIRAVFDGVRRSILPDIVRDAYARAREAYDRKDMATAAAGFDRVLTLLDDPGMADVPGLNDLGTLATGFRDLSKAAAQAAAQAAAAAAAAKPAVTAAAQPAPPPPPRRQHLSGQCSVLTTRTSRHPSPSRGRSQRMPDVDLRAASGRHRRPRDHRGRKGQRQLRRDAQEHLDPL